MNDDRIHESVIELVPSSVTPCDYCSRISVSLNLNDYEVTVGCYDEYDVLASCCMLPFERNAYRLKLNKNRIRNPSSIKSDFFSPLRETFRQDSSLNIDGMGYNRNHLIVLIVFEIILLFVNCISPFLAGLSLIHYVGVIVIGLSVVYIGNLLCQMSKYTADIKALFVITSSMFFDGLIMLLIDSKNDTDGLIELHALMSHIGLYVSLVVYCSIKCEN